MFDFLIEVNASDKELIEFWESVDLRGKFGSPWRYGLPNLK